MKFGTHDQYVKIFVAVLVLFLVNCGQAIGSCALKLTLIGEVLKHPVIPWASESNNL